MAVTVLLEKANYLLPVDKAKIKAQLLDIQSNDDAAIQELEQHLAQAEDNEAYRTFLASLYHKTARYEQSVASYRRLLDRFGQKPAFWLGLALGYDGLQQYHNALQAYQRLREFPQLQPQVVSYIDQRIAAIGSQ